MGLESLLQTGGHWFEPSSAHGRDPLCLLGLLGQSPSLIPVLGSSRQHCVHMRWVPGRVEGVGGVSVEAFVEVAVDVEDGFDAGVPEAGGDDGGVGTLGDEEGDVAVTEVMEPHRLTDRVVDGWEPESAAEGVASDGATLRCGEDQSFWACRICG